ncbi:MAG TPA: glycosyltransferase family 2 protein [Microbacteriaceae bacterium]|jgi:cellulose synthase/poly-beta-1,6-N-acetylglucosamine synthase-like glycosyltransferase|nr:glycosyltransferase family 2 protein [Microbacteriaceae bacterium]
MNLSESTQALAFVMLVVFLAYVIMIVVPFLRRKPEPEGDPSVFSWHVFVPCRDESSVVGATISRLRTDFPQADLWLIDDDSDDDTAKIVTSYMRDDSKVHLVQRRRPDARLGKGAALNAAYRALHAWLGDSAARDHVIVAVVDADGRLAPNAFRQAAGPGVFGNPRTGAAQAAVWMSNRDTLDPVSGGGALKQRWGRYLVRMQDIEFRTTIAAMQCLRGRTLSVGLGGNGQFTRLTALDRIAERAVNPWHGSLLEDYELGVHVMLAGYRNVYMHDTHVEQEALPGLRRLLTQRTRWCQGGMQCTRYLAGIFGSRYITNAGALEASYFLLMPFVQLIGVILWPTVFIMMIAQGALTAGGIGAWLAASWWLLPLIVLTGVLPFAIWPILYRRQTAPERSRWSVLGWGLGYWLYMYQSYVCVLRAFGRVLFGKSGWAKTRRNAESDKQLLAREA